MGEQVLGETCEREGLERQYCIVSNQVCRVTMASHCAPISEDTKLP